MILFILLYGAPLLIINGILLYLDSSLDNEGLHRAMRIISVIPLVNLFVLISITVFLIKIRQNRRARRTKGK